VAGSLDKSGLSPQEIYEKLTGGPGPATLQAAGDRTRQEWQNEEDRAQLIRRLGEHIRQGWHGESGDAAFGAARPLAEAAIQGADKLGTAHDLLNRQGGSFHRAHNDVRPVPPRPPDNPIADMIPFETDLDREIKAYQADAQHNMRVFEGYDNASLYNETNMPKEYSNIRPSGDTITVKSVGGDPGGGETGGDSGDTGDGRRDRAPGGGRPDSSGGPGGPGGGMPIGGPPGVSSPSGAPSGGQTSPSDFRPGTGGFPQSPGAAGPPVGGTVPPGSFLPGGPFPGGRDAGPGGSGEFRGRRPAAGGFGGPGGSGEFGGRGPGAGAGPSGPRGPGNGAGGRGGGPGAGAGALAAEEAAIRRGAAAGPGARGAAGMPMGAMGAGHGKGDDDEEHDRKTMIESGGEDVFGSDVLTAPQVIGDDEYED
jgi:hypothetical protein